MYYIKRLILIIYILIFGIITIFRTYDFFSYDAGANTYFFILSSFDFSFHTQYSFAFMQIILENIHVLIMFFYFSRIYLSNLSIFQSLLLLRVFFDIIGRSYELNHLISLYYYDPKIFLFILCQIIIFYVPSYVICYRYAFDEKEYNYVNQ